MTTLKGKVTLITGARRGVIHRPIAERIAEMHRMRYRVLKGRLDWDVQVSGDMEIDDWTLSIPRIIYSIGDAKPIRVASLTTTQPRHKRSRLGSMAALNATGPPCSAKGEAEQSSLGVTIQIRRLTGDGLVGLPR
jgi:hypothetical protein